MEFKTRTKKPAFHPTEKSTEMHIIILALALTLVSTALATDNPTKPDQPGFCGGYSSAKIDSEMGKAAKFAVKTRSQSTGRTLQLVKILKAERQVVAGLNYRLEIEVADGNKHLNARAVVWKKLDGSMVLTAWD